MRKIPFGLKQRNLNLLICSFILLGSILSYFLFEKNNFFDRKENFKENLVANFQRDSLILTKSDFLSNDQLQKNIEESEYLIEIKKQNDLLYWNKSTHPASKTYFNKKFIVNDIQYFVSLEDAPITIRRDNAADTILFWLYFLGCVLGFIWFCNNFKEKTLYLRFFFLLTISTCFWFLGELFFEYSSLYNNYEISEKWLSIKSYAFVLLIAFFTFYSLFPKTQKPSNKDIFIRYFLGSLAVSIILYYISIFTKSAISSNVLQFKSEEILNLHYKEMSYVILSGLYCFVLIYLFRLILGVPSKEKNISFYKTVSLIVPLLIVTLCVLLFNFGTITLGIALFVIILLLLFDLYFEYFEINISFILSIVLVFSIFLSSITYKAVNEYNDTLIKKTLSKLINKISKEDEKDLLSLNDSLVNSSIIPSLSNLPYPINIDIKDLSNFFSSYTSKLKNYKLSNIYLYDANGKSLALNQISNATKINQIIANSDKINDYVYYQEIDQGAQLHYIIENKSDPLNPLNLTLLLSHKNFKNSIFPFKNRIGVYKNNRLLRTYNDDENIFPLTFGEVSDKNYSTLFADEKYKISLLKGKSFMSKYLPLVTLYVTVLGLLVLILIFLNSKFNFIERKHNLSLNINNSLRGRFQTTIVGLILFSFILIGATTAYYYNRLYTIKNNSVFETITNIIIKEIQNDFPEADEGGFENKIEKLFSKLENNLPNQLAYYRSNGEKLLQGDLFTNAPYRLSKSILRDIVPQKSNSNTFIVSYEYNNDQVLIPVYNSKKDILGFFLTEKTNRGTRYSGLYDFISTLLTVCVFLFLTSLALSMLISTPMTRGLRNLAANLQNYRLGKSNPNLEWKDQDEIGDLIDKFNTLQVELDASAELLSKSQREMAWREMAKQVAHEIKNPLTPMKLSLQHMQMSAKQADEEKLKLIIEKTSKTVLEQIENLTQIANEFSSFGALPKSSNDTIVVNEVVEHIHDLFRKREDMDVVMEEPMNEILVFADRNQLVRILNNIVKNATQAIPEHKRGHIYISLESNEDVAIIKVKDNGTGISEEMKEKVFTPNFTTKSSGTGLGLAISANMIESMNGKLYFDSPNDWGGTTFHIELPLIRSEKSDIEEILSLD